MTLASHQHDTSWDAPLHPNRPLEDRQPLMGLATLLADLCLLILVGVTTSVIYHELVYGHGATPTTIAYVLLVSIVMVLLRSARGDYFVLLVPGKGRIPQLLTDWLNSLVVSIAVSFIFRDAAENSRGALLLFGVTGFVALWASKRLRQLLVFQAAKTARVQTRRAILVGSRKQLIDYYTRERIWQRGVGIAASVTVQPGMSPDTLSVWFSQRQDERPDVSISSLADTLRPLEADDVVLIMPWSQTDAIQSLLDELSKLPATIYLAPDSSLDTIRLGTLGPISISGAMIDHTTGLPGLRLSRRPLAPFDRMAKRAFDIVASLGGLVLLTPFFVVLAIAIMLESPGNPIFRQLRNGFNERPFYIYKFRSMRSASLGAFRQTQHNDDRVTRIGRFIRRTSIDELPQLLNVLLGDMSLVGPRPHAVEHNHAFMTLLANYASRHHVKPGVTGLAQVQGARGAAEDEETMSLRLRYDLEYIQNWSFWLDLNILFLTAASRKASRNAF